MRDSQKIVDLIIVCWVPLGLIIAGYVLAKLWQRKNK